MTQCSPETSFVLLSKLLKALPRPGRRSKESTALSSPAISVDGQISCHAVSCNEAADLLLEWWAQQQLCGEVCRQSRTVSITGTASCHSAHTQPTMRIQSGVLWGLPFLYELREGLVLAAHHPIGRSRGFGGAIGLPRDLGQACIWNVDVLKGLDAGSNHGDGGVAGSRHPGGGKEPQHRKRIHPGAVVEDPELHATQASAHHVTMIFSACSCLFLQPA